MFAGLSRLQNSYSVFRWHKRLQPLKNRTRGFFCGASNCKNLSEKNSFEKNQERQQFLSPWQKTGGGKCWVFVVLTRQKNSFKSHFFTWSMNCFIVLRTREQSTFTSSQVSQVHKKSRVDLTGDSRQLEGLYTVHTSLRRFFLFLFNFLSDVWFWH